MTIAWVVGSKGLLGSALYRKLTNNGSVLFLPSENFNWSNTSVLAIQLASAVQAFSTLVGKKNEWQIYWAAGIGNMGSSAADLISETRALSLLLHYVESDPRLIATFGVVSFASSAGAIYAGSSDYFINENSHPAPTTVYGHEKIIQEELVRSFTNSNKNMSALLARISTLYGPEQSVGKKNGLITHIARCILRNQPVHIYVSLDTVRDYISSDDAATTMISTMKAIKEPKVCTKIIASEQPSTIAEIISIYKRISRRSPKILTSISKLSSVYSRRMQFKSIVLQECSNTPKKSLLIGIEQIMNAELALYMKSNSH